MVGSDQIGEGQKETSGEREADWNPAAKQICGAFSGQDDSQYEHSKEVIKWR